MCRLACCALFMEAGMPLSSHPRRFGAWVEALLLVGLLVAIGGGVVVVGRSSQFTQAGGTAADSGRLHATAVGSDGVPAPSPTSDPATLPSFPQPSDAALRPEDPYHAQVCGHPIRDLNVLTDYASTIVRGIVKQVQPIQWSTSDGRRPPNPHARDNMDAIYRPVIVEVDEYFKVAQPHQTLLIVARGGTVGHDSLDFCGDTTFTFTESEQVVLFLTPSDPSARPTPRETPGGPPVFDVGTHFTITPDGQATSVAQQLPVADLLDQIQAAQRP